MHTNVLTAAAQTSVLNGRGSWYVEMSAFNNALFFIFSDKLIHKMT
jgi:hypothetical protein